MRRSSIDDPDQLPLLGGLHVGQVGGADQQRQADRLAERDQLDHRALLRGELADAGVDDLGQGRGQVEPPGPALIP